MLATRMDDANSKLIGERCRGFRKSQSLTLSKIAEMTGLSKGHLSRFERGQKTLSLASLLRLSEALNVTIGALCDVQAANNGGVWITRNGNTQGDQLAQSSDGINYRVLSAHENDANHQVINLQIAPNSHLSEPAHHAGREIIFVLSGTLDLDVGGKHVTLAEGDYAEFDGTQPHTLKGGAEACNALLVVLTT